MNDRINFFILASVLFFTYATFAIACDTWVAVGNSTIDGSVLLGKNSDRPSLEAQPLVYRESVDNQGQEVKCTHISIPQTKKSYAHIGSKIWWLFGYEMGTNEWGVAIGNEAVWSKEPYLDTGLLGMDLIRLALERSKTAYEAMHLIVDLISIHGQGGGCEYPGEWNKDSKYHNSFIIADVDEAWVLETAGKYWIAKKVKDVWAISNIYTIENDFDESHPDLIKHAIEMGWCNSNQDFNFSRCYMDFTVGDYARAQNRVNSNLNRLENNKGKIDVEFMMNKMCRNHMEGTINAPRWTPNENWFTQTCLHDNPNFIRYRTAASMIAHLRKGMPKTLRQVYWANFSVPCVNVFRPFYITRNTVPDSFGKGTNKYSDDSPWWWSEKNKRICDLNYGKLAPIVQEIFKKTENWELEECRRVEADAYRLIEEGQEEDAKEILEKFCKECIDRTQNEYQMIREISEHILSQVGVDYLWLDFLKEICKKNRMKLPVD
jgi:dipeptidase